MNRNDNNDQPYDPFELPPGYNAETSGTRLAELMRQEEEERSRASKTSWLSRNPEWANVFILVIAIVGAGICLYVPQFLHFSTGNDYPTVGFPSPPFQIEPLSDNPDLTAFTSFQLVNKVTLVNIWGPWCPPCRRELPHINKIRQQFEKTPDFQFVSVAFPQNLILNIEKNQAEEGKNLLVINPQILPNKEEFRRQVVSALDQVKFPAKQIYWDPNGILANALFLSFPAGQQRPLSFPTTILFDSKKVIRAVWVGYTPGDEKQMTDKITEILAETKH